MGQPTYQLFPFYHDFVGKPMMAENTDKEFIPKQWWK
jgi:hypothetical protein